MATTYNTTGETKNARIQTNAARILSYVFLIFVTVLSLAPFVLLLINSTKLHRELTVATNFSLLPSTHFVNNIKLALAGGALGRGLLNSLIVAAGASILSTYFSAMTAYGVHVYDFKLKKFAFNFIMVVMMIPTQISALGFVRLVNNWGLDNTFWPLIIPSIAAPAVFFYMKQYIEGALPMEVIEAARVDGAGEFRIFNMISLPMIFPAMAVQLIFAFTSAWNNYFIPSLIITDGKFKTVPVMIADLRANVAAGGAAADLGKVYMSVLIAIIPVVIVYIFISKYIVEGVSLGAVKG